MAERKPEWWRYCPRCRANGEEVWTERTNTVQHLSGEREQLHCKCPVCGYTYSAVAKPREVLYIKPGRQGELP